MPRSPIRPSGPMIYSMTAFARVDVPLGLGSLQWELKSVNHRHLELQFRLPDAFRELESMLRERLRGALKRGKVDSTLRMPATAPAAPLEVDRRALARLAATLAEVRREVPGTGTVDPLDLLRWPGVLAEPAANVAADRQAVLDAFDTALQALQAHRGREGAMLGDLIHGKLNEIAQLVDGLRATTAATSTVQRDRLEARLAELTVSVDSERLEQEVALLASRADVTEELDRLDIHVAEARSNLAADGPHGRRLDFLLQELNREANTLASKSIMADVAQRAVDLKVLIEQIREQAQNIE
jgi:uncharacterized protein (TIGR00255 family)